MAYWTRRNLVKNAIGLVLLPLMVFLMFRWFEHSQVFQPSRRMETSGASLGRAWEDVYFQAADGPRLNAWFFPATAGATNAELVMILCHGNAGNISHRLLTCRTLLDLGVSLLIFDYRGYGLSSGAPSEVGAYLDSEAAYDWLRQRGFRGNQIVLFGESLGGAVATELALRRPVAGLILLSTFTSIPAIGAELFPWLPVKRLSSIRYDTLSKVPRVAVPLLIMHSQEDTIVHYRHAEALIAAAREPKLRWEIYGDHNDTFVTESERCQEGIRQFLRMMATGGKL